MKMDWEDSFMGDYYTQDVQFLQALQEVKIEQEAEYYAEKIRRILLEEEATTMISKEDYQALEYRRTPQRLNHVKPSDIDHLIDIALDTKDFNWVKKLQKQKELMKGTKK